MSVIFSESANTSVSWWVAPPSSADPANPKGKV